MININPFYSIKMTFAAILILSALTLEAQCQNSISERFNSFILAITSANGDDKQSIVSDQQFVAERPVELELTKARQLQEWIGQVADKFVDEHAIETANYNCKPNIKINDVILDDVILTVGQSKHQIKVGGFKKKFEKKLFLKLLFSFGASLSAEIGGPLHQHENNYLRSLLTAYGCVEGELVAEEKNSDFNFGIRDYKNIKESMYTFDIESVMKNPISGLVTQKVILKMPSAAAEHNNNHQARHIQSFSLLNALNVQLSALDVIQFAQFAAKLQYNALQTNFLNVDKEDKETLGQHTAKYALIAHQLILHIKKWGPNELEQIHSLSLCSLTKLEMCVVNIFTRNLLQRVVKSGFLGEYFGALDPKVVVKFYEPYDQIKKAKEWLQHYEIQSEKCDNEDGLQERLKTADKGSQKTEIFAHYDSAIRIDWNVWKEVKQYVDELIDEAAKMHKDKELSTFFKNGANNKKFELVLTYEQTQTFKLQEYRVFLNTIQRECNEKIKQYEIELPYKINQIETYLKFNNFIEATVQKFGKKLIKKKGEDEKVVCDLDGANKLLDELYEFAIKKIVKKGKAQQEYACRPGQINFETEIKAIMGQISSPKIEDLTNFLFTDKQFVKIPPKHPNYEFLKNAKESQLLNLLYSFATRLEALTYGKNSDGTFGNNGEKDNNLLSSFATRLGALAYGKNSDGTFGKNGKDKIQAFLAVSKCFISHHEWANKSIFDLWMEIKMVNFEKIKKPVAGIEIYKNINDKERQISQDNYNVLKQMNERKFSIYETTNILLKIANLIGLFGKAEVPIIKNLIKQIEDEYALTSNNDTIRKCQFVRLYQNSTANFLEMLNKNNLATELTLYNNDRVFKQIQSRINDEKQCVTAEMEKFVLSNSVRYDLVVNFEHNLRKDIRSRAEDFLLDHFDEKIYAKGKEKELLEEIMKLIKEEEQNNLFKTRNEKIAELQKALNEEDKNGRFDLLKLYEELKMIGNQIVEAKSKLNKETEKRDKLIGWKLSAMYKQIGSLESEVEQLIEKWKRQLNDNKMSPPATDENKMKNLLKHARDKTKKVFKHTEEDLLKQKEMDLNQTVTDAREKLNELSKKIIKIDENSDGEYLSKRGSQAYEDDAQSSSSGKIDEKTIKDKLNAIIQETKSMQDKLGPELNLTSTKSKAWKKQVEALENNEKNIKLLEKAVKEAIRKATDGMKSFKKMLEDIKSVYAKNDAPFVG